MTIAEQLLSVTEQLDAARATIAASKDADGLQRLTSEAAVLRQERDASAADVQTLRARVAELEATNAGSADLAGKLTAATAEVERLKREIQTTRASVEKRAAEMAMEHMAAVGQPFPLKADPHGSTAAQTHASAYSEYVKKLPNKSK